MGLLSRAGRRLASAWAPVVVWMGVIFVLSDQSTLPRFPFGVPDLLAQKSGHFIEYAILAVLCWRALRASGQAGNAAIWAFGIAVLYALSDEWHQTFVRGRHGQLRDVLIDSAGAFVGLGVVQLWQYSKKDAGGARKPAPFAEASPSSPRDPDVADGT